MVSIVFLLILSVFTWFLGLSLSFERGGLERQVGLFIHFISSVAIMFCVLGVYLMLSGSGDTLPVPGGSAIKPHTAKGLMWSGFAIWLFAVILSSGVKSFYRRVLAVVIGFVGSFCIFLSFGARLIAP